MSNAYSSPCAQVVAEATSIVVSNAEKPASVQQPTGPAPQQASRAPLATPFASSSAQPNAATEPMSAKQAATLPQKQSTDSSTAKTGSTKAAMVGYCFALGLGSAIEFDLSRPGMLDNGHCHLAVMRAVHAIDVHPVHTGWPSACKRILASG